jgi:hypothetical protein
MILWEGKGGADHKFSDGVFLLATEGDLSSLILGFCLLYIGICLPWLFDFRYIPGNHFFEATCNSSF